ncbi:rhodanese-like domain-containing protein [Frondihabitans australicus]|uniref:Rhodanese-like domain-containing protein n=1 Tax=Frondihabitans australicus TaxID=386892 RepID=A0A495IHA1_9MICO|nr:ThiF family adenylyltransferase [Frondihabitans australicus]RKR75070.1 rhodanese-like domain-containing protein [Frondihabitans australicus]
MTQPPGSILFIGAGVRASPGIQYAVMAGVGSLGIVDDLPVDGDDVASSPLYPESSLGMPRARAAADWARSIRPTIDVHVHPVPLSSVDDVMRVLDVGRYDTVVDCSGSAETASLLDRALDGRRMHRLPPDLGILSDDLPRITAEALEARLAARSRGDDGFTLLDVRERPEHDVEAIEGSVLAAGFGTTSADDPGIDSSLPVVVYCSRGPRASMACRILRARGFDVTVLDRGMLGWNLRPSALAGGLVAGSGRVPLPLGDIDAEGFRPNLHS